MKIGYGAFVTDTYKWYGCKLMTLRELNCITINGKFVMKKEYFVVLVQSSEIPGRPYPMAEY